MNRKSFISILAALTLSTSLVACGNNTSDGPAVEVDGRTITLADNQVRCAESGGTMNIAIGNAAGAVAAQLTAGDSPKVKAVALGDVDGVTLSWSEGAPGSAEAKLTGKTYEINGKAIAVDAKNPTTPTEKGFRISVTCP